VTNIIKLGIDKLALACYNTCKGDKKMALNQCQINKIKKKVRRFNIRITPKICRTARKMAEVDLDEAIKWFLIAVDSDNLLKYFDNIKKSIILVNKGQENVVVSESQFPKLPLTALDWVEISGCIWSFNLK
jgi:hypothetical protein